MVGFFSLPLFILPLQLHELFQFFMSQRIFDPSDIAKDLWGVVIGLLVLNFGVEKNKLDRSVFKIRKNKLREYLKDPVSGYMLLLIFSFCFLFVSSLLTEAKFFFYILLISLLIFGIVFSIIHFYRDELKRLFQVVFILAIALQVILFISNYNKDFIRHNNFLTVYKGIPLLFFDVLFYPDQTFRFVDKKTEFNKTDKELLLKYEPDIVLIGAGKYGEGGNGFPDKGKSHFIYNALNNDGAQVIILDSKKACVKYNELRGRGLRVLFVLHKSL